MAASEFDQIIIGAGMAGLCCAGELVLNGQRPLLICETPEVGAMFRVKTLGKNNRFFLQHITWQIGWGGGWWHPLARRLNVPFRLHPGVSWAVTIKGTDRVIPVGAPGSPCALIELLEDVLSITIDDETRAQIDRIMGEALGLPHDALCELQEVPFAAWLAERGANEFVTSVLLTLCGFGQDMSLEFGRQHLSVFGGLATLRIMICMEGLLPVVYPNAREGLLIPMAAAIEQRGAEIRRGKKVERVIVEGGQVRGVAFKDGTHVEGSSVAIATGNGRIPGLLDPLPEEVAPSIAYTQAVSLYDFNSYYLLDRPILEGTAAVVTFDVATLSAEHFLWPLTAVAPWTTQPGKQLAGTHFAFTADEIAARGGPDAIYAGMLARAEEMHPGFTAAIEDRLDYQSAPTGTAWLAPVTVGPKIPQHSTSVEGLWFVGDGSDGTRGIWSEAAASAGILGARRMVKER